MSEGEQETKKIFCNTCKVGTNHILLARNFRHRMVHEDVELYEPGDVLASIWSCAGCEEETFEWLYRPAGDPELAPVYFPERSGDSIQPKPFRNLAPKLRRTYEETVRSFNGDSLVLCSMGLGALLEGICTEKGLTGKTRINDLIKFVPNLNVIQALIDFVDARNDAAHRLDAPSRIEARLAIEVMEDLLNFLYDLDYKALQARRGSRTAAFDTIKPGPVQ